MQDTKIQSLTPYPKPSKNETTVLIGVLFGVAVTFGASSLARAQPGIIGVVKPGIILDVRDVDTPGDASVLHPGGLTNGVSGFVDRNNQD